MAQANLSEVAYQDAPIFLHMTKTAGGTLRSAIQDCEDLSTVFIRGTDVDVSSLENDTGLYYGHSVFGVHEALSIQPTYMTFIRHPVRRAISHYYHLNNVDDSAIGDKIRQHSDINQFFNLDSHWEFENFMCRIISGYGATTSIKIENIFSRAIENIDKYFVYIGFQEFFPESVAELSKVLDCSINVNKNVNVGKYNMDDVSTKTFQCIAEMNRFDMKLYKYCLNKFL